MSVKEFWRDCTEHCISQQHGDYLGSAVTLREPTDRELASFSSLMCGNVGCVTDSFGRTLLHLAASLGRRELVQWLVQKCEANINVQDRESGYTSLHRSIFYGHLNVAVTLIQMGADINIRDSNFLSPIELAMKDRPPEVKFSTSLPCEIYVWGTNTNYNLGTDNIQGRQQPELLDFFRKQNRLISTVQVYMDKFHTVMVSACGRVWTCGHGQGGRLGLGSERTHLAPMQVQLGSVTKSPFQNPKSVPGQQEVCVACAAGRDHTILLMESYTVLVFGLNTHHVLGLAPPPAKVLEPHRLPMKYLDDLKFPPQGVCAGRFHSVIWSRGEILTFGLNGGQLGHPKSMERTIVTPKPVNALFYKDVEITHVASSDGAIVVATGNRHIWVLHEYQKSKLSMRYSIEIEQVVVVGGHLDSELDQSNLSEKGEPLKVAAISKEGSVFLWQEKDLQMTRCILSPSRQLKIVNIHLNLSKTAMLLVTDDGEAYSGEIKPLKQKITDAKLIKGRRIPYTQPNYDGECHVLYKQSDKNHIKIFLDPDVCYSVHLERLPNAHRAVKAACDPKGRNFALIQTHPSSFLSNVPELPPEKQGLREDLCNLLSEANEWESLHDIIFEVEKKRLYAHQFIVSRHSNVLLQMIQEAKEEYGKGTIPVVKINDIPSDLFENLLLFMYSGACPLTQPNRSLNPSENLKEDHNKKKTSSSKSLENTQEDGDMSNPVTQAKMAAKKLGLIKFLGQLNHLRYEDGNLLWANCNNKKAGALKTDVVDLEWNEQSEFSDITVVSKDGVNFSLHRCVLAARSEYFHNMLAGGWIESRGTRDLPLPLDQATLSVLFDYIYKDITPSLDKVGAVDFELAMNCLIAADLLLINPFKIRCEAALGSLLTLRNVKIVLELATTYNAPDLQDCCYQFICLNLPALLEMRMLTGLSPLVLQGLRDYYCGMHPRMACRVITPFSTGPSIDFVKELAATNVILWDEEIDFENPDGPESQKKTRYSSKKKRLRKASDNFKSRHRIDSVGSTNSDDMDSSFDLEPLDWSDIVEKEDLNESVKKISLQETADNQERAEKHDQWTKVISNSKASKSVQARLKAAAIVREEMMEIVSPPQHQSPVTTLLLHSYPASPQSPHQHVLSQSVKVVHSKPISPEVMEKHFPQLGGNDISRGSPKVSLVPMASSNEKRPSKLSQKQRKKLALEEGTTPATPVPIAARGWEVREDVVSGSTSSLSLADIMQEQLKKSKQTAMASNPINIKRSPSGSHHMPWGKIDNTLSPSSPLSMPIFEPSPDKSDPSINFSDIVADEMKQRENWTRMRAKPLSLTQIEDRAIDDLLMFYNANEACEERITVRRVLNNKVACPVWVTSKTRDTLPL